MNGRHAAGKTSFERGRWSDLTHPTMNPLRQIQDASAERPQGFVCKTTAARELTDHNHAVLVLGPPGVWSTSSGLDCHL